MEMTKKITTGFCAASLFDGWDDQEQYDEARSAQCYAEECWEAILEMYPDAEIEVLPYDFRTQIDGWDDDPECQFIDDICQRVYHEYDWLVESRV